MKKNTYQEEAIKNINLFEKSGLNKGTAVMPTGTGKTFLAVNFFLDKIKENPNCKLLYICHNKDILEQAEKEEFNEKFSDFEIGYFLSDKKNIKQLNFASVQTLYRNLSQLNKNMFDYIVVDEAHHYQARTYRKVINHFKPKFLLSLTGTPFRTDNKSVYELMGNQLIEKQLKDAINDNMLCGINYWCVDKDINFTNIKRRYNGEYSKKELEKKIFNKEYDKSIFDEYFNIIKNKFERNKTICFCSTRKHAKRMANVFNKNNISSCYLTGDLLKNQRKENISGFKNNKYEVIFVVDLFNEGINVPNCDSVIFLRSTSSKTIFIQQLGRGLRKFKNKDDVLILDFTGNSKNNSLSFEVLSNIVEKNIIDDFNKQKIKIPNKEEFKLEFGDKIKIRLNSYKLESLCFKNINKEDCINEYFKTKKELGRKPDLKELKISQHIFNKLFGGYKDFLIEIGENKSITKEDCINEYFGLKKKICKRPSIDDFNNFKVYNFMKFFGSWNNFLNEIGEKPLINKDNAKKSYKILKKKLKRNPKKNDFRFKNGSLVSEIEIIRMFGNWNNFLVEIGEALNKEDCITEYFRLKKELRKKPSQLDFIISKGAKISTSKIISIFGNWNNFLNEVGDKTTITIKEYQKQYHEKNKEKRKEYQKQYHEKNKEKIKKYYEKNKEKRKEYQKQYHEKNKEKRKEWQKKYNEENKDRIKEYNKNYNEENKEKRKEWQKKYNEKNKEKLKEYQNIDKECRKIVNQNKKNIINDMWNKLKNDK